VATKKDEQPDEGKAGKAEKKPKGEEKSKDDDKPQGAARGTGPTASRQQKRREERLKLIEEQVADGTLTIRQMTPAERKANPPRPPKKKRKRY
jgi:hypothetical protein